MRALCGIYSRPQLARIYAARLARLDVLRVTRATSRSEALLLHFGAIGKRDRSAARSETRPPCP